MKLKIHHGGTEDTEDYIIKNELKKFHHRDTEDTEGYVIKNEVKKFHHGGTENTEGLENKVWGQGYRVQGIGKRPTTMPAATFNYSMFSNTFYQMNRGSLSKTKRTHSHP